MLEIDVQEAARFKENNVLLLDVREADEFAAGHAVGAVSIPMTEIEERFEELPINQDIYVICKSGGRSARVAQALEQAGYVATNVAGGSLAWQAADLPMVSENETKPAVI